MLDALTQAVEPFAPGHASRVAALTEAVAVHLEWHADEIEILRRGAQLHDVGKLAVPAHVLAKRGPLAEHERMLIRTHPVRGAELLFELPSAKTAVPCVLFHHERWDGDGYPTGLAGNDIPPQARLIAIADAYDAMTSGRPYRAPLPADAALAEISHCAGTQFDPILAEVFVRVHARVAGRAA